MAKKMTKVKILRTTNASGMRVEKDKTYNVGTGSNSICEEDARYLAAIGKAEDISAESGKKETKEN